MTPTLTVAFFAVLIACCAVGIALHALTQARKQTLQPAGTITLVYRLKDHEPARPSPTPPLGLLPYGHLELPHDS
jgi:hypothetical protein